MSHPKDEADLVARAAQNDMAAVRTITRLCNRRLYRIARSVVRDDHEPEDVVQAAYGRSFALTGLVDFAIRDPALQNRTIREVHRAQTSGIPSLEARARRLAKRIQSPV